MKLQFRKLLTAGLLALVAVSTPALSQDTGWYAGLGVGQSNFKDGCNGVSGPGISCDDTDTAWNIFGGYQFTKHFSAQLGYVDLGELSAEFAGFGSANIKAKGFELLGGGTYPINEQFSVYGKLGFFRWDVDFNDGTGLVGSTSDTGTSFTHVIGVKYNFTKTIAGTLQWQRYYNIGDSNTTGQSDIDVIGVGVIFKF